MAILGRIQCAILLASLSFAAFAENYKCKLPDGSTTYQDRPCSANGATQQVVAANTGAVLGSSMSEAAMVGLRVGARRAAASGAMSKMVAACIDGQDNMKFYSAFQHLLAENFSAGDLKIANAFFNGPTGRKFAKRNILKVYTSMGEVPPEPAPVLSVLEENEVAEFTATAAGQALITRKFLSTAESLPLIVERLQEIKNQCGARHW